MTVYACMQCGHDVAADARRCPNCGTKRPAPTVENAVKAFVGAAILLLILIAMVAH